MNKKIALYALTGFLGAGKTTLLTHLLYELGDKKVGIIQNEFGKLGIDGEILKSHDNIEMVEINKGSIFCSCLKFNFLSALIDMSKQDLDCVFIESSGLADPSNIGEILTVCKQSAGDVYDFRGVICLVDALHFDEQIHDIETVDRQLKHCNLVVISKLDLVRNTIESTEDNLEGHEGTREHALETLIGKIREVNPVCKITTADYGKLDESFLSEDLLLYQWAESEDTTNSVENKPKTLFLNCHRNVTGEQFSAFIEQIKVDCYRLKGFFLIDNAWQQVDVVGNKVDYKPCEAKEYSEIVIISKIGPGIIKPIFEIWQTIFGEKPELKN